MFQPSPIGFLALTAVAMCWSLAVVLYRTGTPGSVARMLSLRLVVEGTTLIPTGFIDVFLVPAVKAGPSCPAWLRAEEIVRTAGAERTGGIAPSGV